METAIAQEYRKFYGTFVKSQLPEYAFTVTLVNRYSDTTSKRAFDFLMRSIQRKIPSRRAIRGIASIERTWINTHFAGHLHMHCLLWGIDKEFDQPEKYISEVIRTCVLRLRDSKGRRMASVRSYQLTRAYSPERATNYLTKDLYRNDDRECQILLISAHGLDIKDELFQ